MLGEAFDSLGTLFPKNRQQTPSLTLKVVGSNLPIAKLVNKLYEEPRIIGEPIMLVSQLRRQRKKSKFQPNLEPTT